MRVLCLDFGNTLLKAALVKDGVVEEHFNFKEATASYVLPIIHQTNPDICVLSSVIHHDTSLEQAIAEACPFHLLTHISKLNFTTDVEQPQTIGADRIALMAGAVALFPKHPVLVISMGTCITYSFINKNHQFTGGAISPGVEMRFKAMHEYTSRLPLTSFETDVALPAKDTHSNLQAGVFYGVLGELTGFISDFKQENNDVHIILTGGSAPFFAERLKLKIFADRDLLFNGLYALAKINV